MKCHERTWRRSGHENLEILDESTSSSSFWKRNICTLKQFWRIGCGLTCLNANFNTPFNFHLEEDVTMTRRLWRDIIVDEDVENTPRAHPFILRRLFQVANLNLAGGDTAKEYVIKSRILTWCLDKKPCCWGFPDTFDCLLSLRWQLIRCTGLACWSILTRQAGFKGVGSDSLLGKLASPT